jgi:hypothetical protein
MFLCVWRLSEDCRLIKTAVLGIHSEIETRVDSFHGVVWGREFSGDGICAGELGSAVMRR